MNVFCAGVVLDLVKSNHHADFVMSDDGTQLLYVKHLYEIEAVFNPDCYGTATGLSPPVAYREALGRMNSTLRPKVIVFQPSALADIGDFDEKQFLAALVGQAGDAAANLIQSKSPYEIVLETPKRGQPVDANNGPQVAAFSVSAVEGESLYGVRLQVLTYVTPCSNSSPIASHRWTMLMAADEENFHPVRTIHGDMTFRMDRLLALGIPQDLFLGMVPPKPWGYDRLPVEAELSEGGEKLTYTITDVKRPLRVDPFDSGIVHLQVMTTTEMGRGEGAFGLGLNLMPDTNWIPGSVGRLFR